MARSNGQPDRRDHGADVAIVGAGIIGLATAWRAARAGLEALVIERRAVGAGATPVAAGMLAPAGEAQWGQGPLTEACAAAAALWPEFATELEGGSGVDIGYSPCGALHVAMDRDEAAELKRRLPLVHEVDPAAEWCLASRCREHEPGLAPGSGPGILIEHEAAVDTRRLLDGLREASLAAGARLIEGEEPAELRTEAGAVAGLRLVSGAEVKAPRVVIAAGAWSGGLAWLPREVRPQIRPVKGEVLRLRAPAPLARHIVHTERVYVVPRSSGEVVVGATMEDTGFDTTVKAGAVHELLREAYRVLPDVAECEFVEAAAGLRPASADGAPYLGETEIPGLHLACGHYRNGILLAPLSAEATIAGLTGVGPPAAAVPFSLRGAARSEALTA